jgi:hypothetical protein
LDFDLNLVFEELNLEWKEMIQNENEEKFPNVDHSMIVILLNWNEDMFSAIFDQI